MEKITTNMTQKGLSMEVDKEQFAMALKTWRLRTGLTQEQVGKRWGCSRWTIIKAELAKALTWQTAYKLFARLSEELRLEALKEQRDLERAQLETGAGAMAQ